MPATSPSIRLLLPLLLGLAQPLAGQRVEIQVREEGSRAPVGGAIVRLLADSTTVAQGLTNEAGRITLRAAAPGSYRIKVDRIGWVGLISAAFRLGAEQVFQTELVMPPTRLELPDIQVQTRSRCDRQGLSGREALPVWEEIQKALTANVLTAEAGTAPLHVREFRRWLRRNGDTVAEYNISSSIERGQVYASLPPALLASEGFLIGGEADTVTFAVPDAALLISDAFAATHCFGVTGGEEGRIGLTFEPIPGRRLPEVKGTMWVDRSTSELAYLEYQYTGLTGLLARADLGGRVEFQRLPSGAWIVKYWHVRTPDIAMSVVRGTGNVQQSLARHVGYVELGGRVSIAANDAGELNLSIVQGRVTDQTADGIGLPGAVIRVRGSGESVLTDANGRYQLASPLFGDQEVTATHPKLGLLGKPAEAQAIFSVGDTIQVDFAVPPMADFVRAACGGRQTNRSGIIGLVLDPGGHRADGYEIRASWRSPGGGAREVRAQVDRQRGVFGFCDLPADELVTLRVYQGSRPLTETTVEVGFRAFTWRDLWLPAP